MKISRIVIIFLLFFATDIYPTPQNDYQSLRKALDFHRKGEGIKKIFTRCEQKDNPAYSFAKLAAFLDIPFKKVHMNGHILFEYYWGNDWHIVDPIKKVVYLSLDNKRLVSSDEILDDPLIAIRTKVGEKVIDSLKNFAQFEEFTPKIYSEKKLNIEDIETLSIVMKKEECSFDPTDLIIFDHEIPHFEIPSDDPSKHVVWQISTEPDFSFIIPNLEGVSGPSIEIDPLTDTFFNPNKTYYFRAKFIGDRWSHFFQFVVEKPNRVTDIHFERLGIQRYEVTWEKDPDDEVSYLIFGSNALDFIPSVYSEIQINEIKEDKIIGSEPNHNLVCETNDHRIEIDGSYAYYRIIAKKQGKLSNPSELIYVYDNDLEDIRTVLQCVNGNPKHVKRQFFPLGYSEYIEVKSFANCEDKVKNSIDQAFPDVIRKGWIQSPYASDEAWQAVQPYLLPFNHPAKPKLDRIFTKSRASYNGKSFKKAGFKNYKQHHTSKVIASSHKKVPGYYVKIICDLVRDYKEWEQWVHRIIGRNDISHYIKAKKLQWIFKVPKKWIYPLPPEPSPPNSPDVYRKNFILIAEDMNIMDKNANKGLWKQAITPKILDQLFLIVRDLGLWDSVRGHNVPWTYDGKLAFVDTQLHHHWPVPYEVLYHWLDNPMRLYWGHLIKYHGPTH